MGEMLYRVAWNRLEEYEVLKRTAKTATVKGVAGTYGWTHTLRSDSLAKYYPTPREAWQAETDRLNEAIRYAKEKLQELRSALGTAEKNAK